MLFFDKLFCCQNVVYLIYTICDWISPCCFVSYWVLREIACLMWRKVGNFSVHCSLVDHPFPVLQYVIHVLLFVYPFASASVYHQQFILEICSHTLLRFSEIHPSLLVFRYLLMSRSQLLFIISVRVAILLFIDLNFIRVSENLFTDIPF